MTGSDSFEPSPPSCKKKISGLAQTVEQLSRQDEKNLELARTERTIAIENAIRSSEGAYRGLRTVGGSRSRRRSVRVSRRGRWLPCLPAPPGVSCLLGDYEVDDVVLLELHRVDIRTLLTQDP
jgi:hypothetical protein